MERFIVGEITKNWDAATPVSNLIAQQFERVINLNNDRGYKLIDWKFNVTVNDGVLTETIIAIFEIKE
jgi:hypothetical protein